MLFLMWLLDMFLIGAFIGVLVLERRAKKREDELIRKLREDLKQDDRESEDVLSKLEELHDYIKRLSLASKYNGTEFGDWFREKWK